MAMTVKLPGGEEAQVTEATTLRLSSGAQVTVENMPARQVAEKNWGNIVNLIDRLSSDVSGGGLNGLHCIEIHLPGGNTLKICFPGGTGPTFPGTARFWACRRTWNPPVLTRDASWVLAEALEWQG